MQLSAPSPTVAGDSPARPVRKPASTVDALLAGFEQLTPSLLPPLPSLREQIARDERASARAASRRNPTRGADAVLQGERELEPNSRSFRRQLARASASQARETPARNGSPGPSNSATGNLAQAPGQTPGQLHTQSDAATPLPGAASPAATSRPTLLEEPVAASARAPLPERDFVAAPPRAGQPASSAAPASIPAAPQFGSSLATAPVLDVTTSVAGQSQSAPASASAAPASSTAALGAPALARAEALDGQGSATRGGTSAALPATSAEPGDDADSADEAHNVARIVRLVHSRMNKDGGVATLRLDPPELGSLRVHMELRDGALSLRFEPENELARQLLQNELGALRRGLETSGMQLEQVEIRPVAPPPTTEGRDGQSGWADGSQTSAHEPGRQAASHSRRHREEAGMTGAAESIGHEADEITTAATAGQLNVLA